MPVNNSYDLILFTITANVQIANGVEFYFRPAEALMGIR
jgi:hypothetical protein